MLLNKKKTKQNKNARRNKHPVKIVFMQVNATFLLTWASMSALATVYQLLLFDKAAKKMTDLKKSSVISLPCFFQGRCLDTPWHAYLWPNKHHHQRMLLHSPEARFQNNLCQCWESFQICTVVALRGGSTLAIFNQVSLMTSDIWIALNIMHGFYAVRSSAALHPEWY